MPFTRAEAQSARELAVTGVFVAAVWASAHWRLYSDLLLFCAFVLLPSCAAVAALLRWIRANTPVYRTDKIRDVLPRAEFWVGVDRALVDQHPTALANRRVDDVTAQCVYEHILDDRRNDSDMPFPLGFAFAALLDMRADTNAAVAKLKAARLAFGRRTDQENAWSTLELEATATDRNISRWMAYVKAHPRFHVEFQSHQAYVSRRASEAALRSANDAKSAAERAELFSMLSWMSSD